MDYEQFITEIQKYWDLREKGLKKQANSFLFTFTKFFKEGNLRGRQGTPLPERPLSSCIRFLHGVNRKTTR